MGTTPPPPDATSARVPSTPKSSAPASKTQHTPEQIRRMETNRLRAKAIREQKEKEAREAAEKKGGAEGVRQDRLKRKYGQTVDKPGTGENKDGQASSSASSAPARGLGSIHAARKFANFVEYDFSKMTDTKGGFLSTQDDPNSILAQSIAEGKPANMTLEEWERLQLKMKLVKERDGAFAPAISRHSEKCHECGSPEIDYKFLEVYKCRVCNKCKEKFPDKYSLLTKTECREDYLLTDPELRDEELLGRMERPNPHKSNWATMQLFLRFQVEEFAFKKWGSPEALDAEFEKRTKEYKRKKDAKFKKRLDDLKKRTRVETWKREGKFGGSRDKHQHEWGEVTETGDGPPVKTCATCGMEVEELII